MVEQVLAADRDVGLYLKECVGKILGDGKIRGVIQAHLFYETADERLEIIIDKMKRISKEL